MNQILISEKLYVTPELKRRKRIYKIDFFISVFLVFALFSYYVYAEYDKSKNEAISQEILLESLSFVDDLEDDTTIKFTDSSIVVILNSDDPYEVIYSEELETEVTDEGENIQWLITENGTEYYRIATINIPSIGVTYPILDHTTEELLKIAPTKFWGADPNEEGNFCIVGHNYRSNKFFSKVPKLTNGDIIEITDLKDRTYEYEVYDKYVVDPTDVSCTTQKTNGQTEITLITCTDNSKQRVIIKARKI